MFNVGCAPPPRWPASPAVAANQGTHVLPAARPALWDVNLSAVRRTPITTHTLRVRRNVALTRKIADSRGQPAAASSARISGRQVGSRPTTGPRTASGKAGLSCSAAFLCTVPPAHGDPAPDFLSRTPCAAHPRAAATCAGPPVPPAPRASAACRAPCAPCFNKNGVDIPIGGHRIRGGTYFPLLKRFVGRGTAAPPNARWRCSTHKRDRNKIETNNAFQ